MRGNIEDLNLRLEQLKEKTNDMSPVMKKIAGAMRTKVRMNFRNQQDPEGNPWKKSKRAESDSGMTLADTGRLKNSITISHSGTHAAAGTNVKYARVMHFGTNKGAFGTHTTKQNVRPFSRVRNGNREQVRAHTRTRSVLTPFGDIPSRKFIGMTTEDKEKYLNMIKDHLEKE
ncbi:MAG: phage virion morphogenesis protein [Fusobacteriaceae bacterium]